MRDAKWRIGGRRLCIGANERKRFTSNPLTGGIRMDIEKAGLKAQNELLQKRVEEREILISALEVEVASLHHALTVAQGQLRLMHQDRDFVVAA